jgi:hypothetical protein
MKNPFSFPTQPSSIVVILAIETIIVTATIVSAILILTSGL